MVEGEVPIRHRRSAPRSRRPSSGGAVAVTKRNTSLGVTSAGSLGITAKKTLRSWA